MVDCSLGAAETVSSGEPSNVSTSGFFNYISVDFWDFFTGDAYFESKQLLIHSEIIGLSVRT